MDRVTAYPSALIRETDPLTIQQNTMVALAELAQAVLGTSTIADGFTCTPTTPASASVILTPGQIYQLENIEATAWSSLPSNTASSIVKQGLMLTPDVIGITPPTTTGYSQSFLIEAQYADLDTSPVLLPYYNASNPSVPYSGPGNSGASQNTARLGIAAIQVKAGVAAASGSQIIPTPDAGWVGLFVVTVAAGATTVTSGNIATYNGAPFLPVKLPGVPFGVQSNAWVYAVDQSASPGTIVAVLSPAPPSFPDGAEVLVKAANAAAGSSVSGGDVANINGIGNLPIKRRAGAATVQNDWAVGDILVLRKAGNIWQLGGLVPSDMTVILQQTINNYAQPILTAPQTYYVSGASGSDSNNGTSSSTAFATLQKAENTISKFNLNGFNVAVIVAAGAYAPVSLQGVSGSGTVTYTAQGTVSIVGTNGKTALAMNNGSNNHVFNGFTTTVTGTSSGDPGLGVSVANPGSGLTLLNHTFGFSQGGHIGGALEAIVYLGGSLTVSGGTGANGAHMSVQTSAQMFFVPGAQPALTITGALGTGAGWAVATGLANIQVLYSSVSGASNVSGPKYNVSANAVINTQGGGANYFPGNSAGASSSGGQYL